MLLEGGEDSFELECRWIRAGVWRGIGVFESHGGSLAGVRGYGVGGVADEDGAAGAPAREAGDVVDGYVEDVGCGLDELWDGCGPVAVEGHEALLNFGFGSGGLCSLSSSGATAVLHQRVRGPSGVMVLK